MSTWYITKVMPRQMRSEETWWDLISPCQALPGLTRCGIHHCSPRVGKVTILWSHSSFVGEFHHQLVKSEVCRWKPPPPAESCHPLSFHLLLMSISEYGEIWQALMKCIIYFLTWFCFFFFTSHTIYNASISLFNIKKYKSIVH